MKFANIYDTYWESGRHPHVHWTTSRIEREFSPLRQCSKILDYGCGMVSRKYGDVLAKSCDEYVGADVSPYVVAKNKEDGFHSCTIDPQGGSIDLPDSHFDGAVCCEVLEHLYDPLAAAREIHRLLKPSGTVIAMVPNFGYHAWRVQALLRAQVPHEPEDSRVNKYNGVHIRYFSMLTFKRLLLDAGFSDVKVAAYDFSSVWDVTRGLGPLARISDWARNHLPQALQLTWLQDLYPNLFAMRLKAVAIK